jgi:hypothetical protein
VSSETVSNSFAESIYAATISSEIIKELRPQMVMRPFLKRGGQAGVTSPTVRFLLRDKPSLPAALAEGADLGAYGTGNTEITTSMAEVTVATVAQKATVSDFVQYASVLNVVDQVKDELARGAAEKFETDATALLPLFTTTTGPSGAMDVDAFLTALGALEARDVAGSLVWVAHTKQTGDVRKDIVESGGPYFESGSNGEIAQANMRAGYVGVLFNIPVYANSLVPTSDSGVNRAGAIFDANDALGMHEFWGYKADIRTDEAGSALASEVIGSQCYGVGQISNTRGQCVKSTA